MPKMHKYFKATNILNVIASFCATCGMFKVMAQIDTLH